MGSCSPDHASLPVSSCSADAEAPRRKSASIAWSTRRLPLEDALVRDAASQDEPLPRTDAGGDSHTISQGGSTTILAGDAGVGTCKLLRPALMQPYSGPAVIRFVRVGGAEVAELVFNDGGHPQLSDAPLVAAAATRDVAMPAKSTLPSCAVAGRAIYCPDANGAIHLALAGDSDVVVAKSRPGTPISAARIGDGHRVLAYLEENATSEGSVRQAKIRWTTAPRIRCLKRGAVQPRWPSSLEKAKSSLLHSTLASR